MIVISGLALSGVNESDTFDLNVGGAIGSQKLGGRIEDEWIEVTVGLVVTGVRLTVDRHFDVEDVWLGVLWHLASDQGGARESSFGVNPLFWCVTESAKEV